MVRLEDGHSHVDLDKIDSFANPLYDDVDEAAAAAAGRPCLAVDEPLIKSALLFAPASPDSDSGLDEHQYSVI